MLALAVGFVLAVGTAAAAQGGGPAPIRLVVNTVPGCTAASPTCNPFGPYLAEILRAEGINTFDVVELATVQPATLADAALVILAETGLTDAQASTFTAYVQGGGRLVAMRPDPRLAPVLGITVGTGETVDGYFAIDTSMPTGSGLPTETLPFRGRAAHYAPGIGSETLASLYSAAVASTFNGPTTGPAVGFPAVVRSGRTATWSFDVARSVAYVRQGDPALAGVERDGIAPLRTVDVFFGNLDLDRMPIPHGDFQMRLLARVIEELMADSLPLPRLWYFPDGQRTVLVVTGDDHDSGNWPDFIAGLNAHGAKGALYVVDYNRGPDAQNLAAQRQAGFEFGLHPWVRAGLPWTAPDLRAAYQTSQDWFTARGTVPSRTVRNHQVGWLGWAEAAKVAAEFNVGMDTSFYSWGPAVTYTNGQQAKGYSTGSGLPMRFVDETGTIVPVFQQVTSLIDEQLVVDSAFGGTCCSERLSTSDAIAVSQQVIDASQAGGYAAVTTQFHVDFYRNGDPEPQYQRAYDWANATMDYAGSLGIPIWTGERWLRFWEARAATGLTNIAWTQPGDELTFTLTVPAGAEPLPLYVPPTWIGLPLGRVSVDGAPVTHVRQEISGREVAMFSVTPGANGAARTVRVKYGDVLVPGNSIPTAEPDQVSTPLATPVTVAVLANDSDPDGDVLEVTEAGPAASGQIAIAADGSITYAPSGTTCGPDSFSYTIDDGRGGIATALVTVTVGCANSVTHTTPVDFAATCAVQAGTRVTAVGDGEVRLAGTLGDEFAGTSLSPQWASSTTPPTISGGLLTVSGPAFTWVWVRSATLQTVTTLEARAQFSAGINEHVGWASTDFSGDRYFIFSTRTGDGNLYARSNIGSGEQRTDLGALPGGFHDYRIERVAQAGGTNLINYYVDGALVAQHAVGTVQTLHAYVSSAQGAAIAVDHLWVAPPHVASGVYDSCAIDATGPVTWTTVTWQAQVSGGSFGVRTRTSMDASNWSAWSGALTTSGDTVTSPPGRYLQYRLELATPDADATPVLESITLSALSGGAQGGVPVASADAYTIPEDGVLTVGAPGVLGNDTDPDGDPLTATVLSGPAFGTLALTADGAFTYTPTGNFNGTDDFTYRASDGTLVSAAAAVTITVTSVNDPPLAVSDTYAATAGVALVTSAPGVLANDTDPEGNALTASVVTGPTSGTLTLNTDGSFTYTAAADFTGTDSFTYAASDGILTSTPAVVTLTVSRVNNAPVAVADAYTTVEDTALSVGAPGVLANDTDLDGDPLTAIVTTGPAHGAVVLSANGSFLYTPALDYAGADSFTYAVSDGVATSTPATVTITVTAANDAPVAHAQAVTTGEDTPVGITLTGSDPDGDPLTYALGTGPAHGTLTGTAPTLTYTPNANYTGADSFTFTVSDSTTTSAPATVTITVTAVSDPPVADAQAVTTARNTPVAVTLTGSDPDGDPLTYAVVTQPANGTLAGTAPTLTYTPAANFTGSDSFTFTVSDGSGAPSPTGAVRVNATGPGNYLYRTATLPTIGQQTPYTVTSWVYVDTLRTLWQGIVALDDGANNWATIQLDDEGDNFEFIWKDGTNPGTPGTGNTNIGNLTAQAGQWYFVVGQYDPANDTNRAGYALEGDTALRTWITSATPPSEVNVVSNTRLMIGNNGWSNEHLDGRVAMARLWTTALTQAEIEAEMRSPVAVKAAGLWADYPLTSDGSDVSGHARHLSTLGTVSYVSGPTLPSSQGTTSAPATVTITVTAVNDAPVAHAQTVTTGEDTPVGITLTGSDPDGDPLTYALGTGPAHGTLTGTAPTLTYTPNPNYTGADSFTFTVSDPTTTSAPATVTITVTAANDAPTVTNPGPQTSAEGATISLPIQATDVDTGTTLTYSATGLPAGLAIDGTGVIGGTLGYATAGTYTVTVTVSDNAQPPATAQTTFGWTVTNVNRTPTANAQSVTVAGNTATAITLTGSDPDGDALAYVVATLPAHGTLTGTAPNLTYTPNASFAGTDGFTFAVTDGNLTSAPATVTITVTPALTLSINDVSIVEGNSGQRSAVFAVTLSAASAQSVAVNYATSNGTAAAGTDYRSRSGTLTFTAGVTSTTISVPVLGDKLPEPNETFNVTLGNAVNATIQRPVGIGTIVDDDTPQPSISMNDVTVQESGSAVFTVTLSAASQHTVTVAYTTADGTATAGSDYTAVSGSLTFAPGQTGQTVAVSTIDDALAEPSETFQLLLSNASGATILDGTGVATIVDDDGTAIPAFSINDVRINEGNSGTRNVTLTVTLSSASAQTVTVNYATADGSATAPSDYQAQTGALSFSPGVTSRTIRIAVVGDRLREPTEVFYVDLAGATNASIQKSRGAVTIPAND